MTGRGVMRGGESHRSRALWAGVFGLILGCAEGAGFDGAGASAGCTPGVAVACECPGGSAGAQVCAPDGAAFLACQCSGGDSGETGSVGDSGGAGQSSDSAASGDDEDVELCGDGVEDPGECDPDDPLFCPDDCGEVMDTGGDDPCAGAATFFASVPGVGSRWEHMGFVGFAAGDAMCQGIGADHVCDYEEVLDAQAKGELAGLPLNSTAWIHRTTMANTSAGDPSPPGLGGRCVDWTYTTNHLSDGEYVVFAAGGPEYHIDDDTFYDGTSTEHTQTDLMQCGNEARAVLCCHAACQ